MCVCVCERERKREIPISPNLLPSTLTSFPSSLPPTTTPAIECEEGWEMFELSCYWFSNTQDTWTNAKTKCAEKDAYLTSITSQAEQIFIQGKAVRHTHTHTHIHTYTHLMEAGMTS